MKFISRGAEAEIFLDRDIIIKKRIPKKYRLKEIDETLRSARTKREAKVIDKMPISVPHPLLRKTDLKEMNIEMSYVSGQKIRDILDDRLELCTEIGEKIGLMHNAGIIHGDLTTSNMIQSEVKVFFIDFGLSFFSEKAEDKAVDLHLLKQALESKHYRVYEKAFALVLKGYKKKCAAQEDVLKRYYIVEKRGRNKSKF